MLYNIIILELSISFYVIYAYDCVTVTITYNIILTPNPKFKIRKLNENK